MPSALNPITLFCDNTGAIALAKEPRFHKKSRHIKRRFNLIRDYVEGEDVNICKVHTDLNVADPLTKLFHGQNMIDTRTVWVLDLLQCNSHGDVRARLLTLVQVGDCWNYALEAILNIVIIIIPVSR